MPCGVTRSRIRADSESLRQRNRSFTDFEAIAGIRIDSTGNFAVVEIHHGGKIPQPRLC